jgi:hypothetical protein
MAAEVRVTTIDPEINKMIINLYHSNLPHLYTMSRLLIDAHADSTGKERFVINKINLGQFLIEYDKLHTKIIQSFTTDTTTRTGVQTETNANSRSYENPVVIAMISSMFQIDYDEHKNCLRYIDLYFQLYKHIINIELIADKEMYDEQINKTIKDIKDAHAQTQCPECTIGKQCEKCSECSLDLLDYDILKKYLKYKQKYLSKKQKYLSKKQK